jgi:hypothetical protein
MNLITERKEKLGVMWHYEHFLPTKPDPEKPAPVDKNYVKVRTSCVIYNFNVDPSTILTTAVTELRQGNHCRDTARKCSLLRAMKNLGFNKEERKKLWQQYFFVRGYSLNDSKLARIAKSKVIESAKS